MPKGIFHIPNSDTRSPRLDAQAAKAERPAPRQVHARVLVDGEKTYHVYLAEEVLARNGIYDPVREDRYRTEYNLSLHPTPRRRGAMPE